jgi:hypothetical protein
MSELISLLVPTDDVMLDTRNIRENINIFANMIVGQSVHALKSCSISENDKSKDGPPCLVVSTIYLRIPSGSLSVYQVYSLTPLPVIFKGEKYVYSDLPNIFGFNSIDKKLVLWNDNKLASSCIFSEAVQCRNYSISISISSVPCLNQLCSPASSALMNCQVTKSKENGVSISNIKNNIWYFYSSDRPTNCELQSLSSPLIDTISIKEPMIVSRSKHT